MRVIENPETGETASEAHARRKAERLANRPEKKKKVIPKVSAKRKKENEKYSAEGPQWFLDNPKCKAKLQGCTGDTEHRHHTAGRGSNLNAKETFLPVCSSCHYLIHNVMSAKERRKLGLLRTVNLNRDIEKETI